MKIISGDPQSGKTHILLNTVFGVENAVIVVADNNRKNLLDYQLLDRFEIQVDVITIKTFMASHVGRGRMRGSDKECNYFFEDFNDCIEIAFTCCNIQMLNLTPDIHLQYIPNPSVGNMRYISDLQSSRKALIKKNESLFKDLGKMQNSYNTMFCEVKDYRDAVDEYNNLPWFKRMFARVDL